MKVYVINLDRSEDRLRNVVEVFACNNIDFVRVSAVDGKEYAKSLKDWHYPLTPPEVGCFYSHIKCFELIAAGNEKYGAIFEDDVIFSKSISYFLDEVGWIPKDADIVKIETKNEINKIKINNIEILIDSKFSIGRLCSKHLGTAGYIISKNTAQYIINKIKKPIIPIDNYLFSNEKDSLKGVCVYQLFPALCKQKSQDSIIDAERCEWHAMEVEERRRKKIQIGFLARIIREIKRPLRKYKKRFLEHFFKVYSSHRVGKGWRRIPFE